jgi:uncharacterized phage protein (TIGR01671 family)
MREIKFRAWYKGYPYPLDPNDLDSHEKPQMVYDVQNIYDGSGVDSVLLMGCGSFGSLLEDDEFELMQYTGLKDKNGKEIFENDILEHEGWKYIIKWDDKGTGFYLFDPKSDCTIYDEWGCEDHLNMTVVNQGYVIGNTYENPELLEETK